MKRRTLSTEYWPAPPAASETGFTARVPGRREGVSGVEIDDESVLYDEHNDRLHHLNWSASAVWWLIDGTTTVDDLARALATRFHADPQAMRSDVLTLLGVLGSEQLVEARPALSPRGIRA